ncbi:hypothetical protein [Streptomyces sp. NBRC 110028]|uniref:carbamoyl phosphate synthase preATP-grasp domain-containing protein n=1 Tax=Streptomyces sp. NBRC 110028 TaxID=1621260 RepID=UPI0006E32532|nr:hypothetical protein [Streptomyces sp. NBRC 110028]
MPKRTDIRSVLVIGSGPIVIGQGIEFDYSCVHTSFALSDAGYETVMVNCNPGHRSQRREDHLPAHP